jgi:hypothetical protein
MVVREFGIEGRTATPMLGTGRRHGRVIQSWAGVKKKLALAGGLFYFFIYCFIGMMRKRDAGNFFTSAEPGMD